MAIVIETYIHCDGGCGAVHGGDCTHLKGMAHRKHMIDDGWVYTTNKDYCPACRKKRKDGSFMRSPKRGTKHAKK